MNYIICKIFKHKYGALLSDNYWDATQKYYRCSRCDNIKFEVKEASISGKEEA